MDGKVKLVSVMAQRTNVNIAPIHRISCVLTTQAEMSAARTYRAETPIIRTNTRTPKLTLIWPDWPLSFLKNIEVVKRGQQQMSEEL